MIIILTRDPLTFLIGSHLEQLFNFLPLLPLKLTKSNVQLRAALLRFTTALYAASDMALWLGSGRTFLQRSWDEAASDFSDKTGTLGNFDVKMQPSLSLEQQQPNGTSPGGSLFTFFTLPFHACLAELSWGGWKLIALPLVLKHTLPLFTQIGQEKQDGQLSRFMLAFFAALTRSKKLSPSDVDIVWRERLEKCCLDKIIDGMNEEEVIWTEERVSKDIFLCRRSKLILYRRRSSMIYLNSLPFSL